ncbi:MAG: hypothetical protein HY743_01795 [Deltaproteobacteria bacterium]|nr:hypothetical protein [Deltaproteobacteria bacterium]
MQDLIDMLDLRNEIRSHGYDVDDLNFESFYDDLASTGSQEKLRALIENRVFDYFSRLKLPDKPTIYDYLVLSLRKKDVIATFNWDPFLLQAFMRNEVATQIHRPQILFLHGNVLVGVCYKDETAGIAGRRCLKCGNSFEPTKLLYPVKHKDYTSDPFIKSQWDALRMYLKRGYYLTVFGYSAPKTDVEARRLMLEVWKANSYHNLCEVEIIDVKPRSEVEENWGEFFYSHHYIVRNNIRNSDLFKHPRRSCDAFSSATLMLDPWDENPFPKFRSLKKLQSWLQPLIEEEEAYERSQAPFSGKPLLPNIASRP